MTNKERKISRYIDQFNSEKMPGEHKAAKIPPEYEKLLETMRSEAASIRCQEQGYEYLVLGNTSLVELSLFAKELTKGEVQIPTGEEKIIGQPQIEVPVDLVTEENDQKSVDAGHSPWKLDPAFVAQVFVSLLISPEGVKGDYPIPYEDVKITTNTGTEAIAQVRSESTPARYVYLKRLIRQDETGIWTVVGYDPVD